jgi:hypothetical protein
VGAWRLVTIVAAASAFAACANGLLTTDDTSNDASLPNDATTTNDSPSTNDAGKLGPDGACNSPTTKCTSDAGAICVDTQTDTNHCGGCTNACTQGDAGSLAPGPNNPDAGVVYDGGSGWMLGAPECEAGTCAVTCTSGFTDCDGICFDTQNFHDHCGTCSTACTSQEWCVKGNCCALGQEYCSGSCIDVESDKNNCGACGNVCPAQTPVCSNGTCVSAVTYSQAFTSGATPSTQCTAWTTFQAALTGTYTSITVSGTNDTTGRTCTGTGANTLCQALHSGTATNVVCNGHTWYVDTCGAVELTADDAACMCETPGYSVRPCIGNLNWGGVNTTTCSPPSQTLTVTCQ